MGVHIEVGSIQTWGNFRSLTRDLREISLLLIHIIKELQSLYACVNLGSPRNEAKGGASEESLKVFLCLSYSWRECATIIFCLSTLR